MRFTHGVTAQYGPTTVESDELEIHDEATGSYGIAQGHVILHDTVGKITGDRIQFAWTTQTGSAENVVIMADSLKAKVAHVELLPTLWTLRDVEVTGYTNKVGLLNLKSPRVEVTPGKSMVVRKPKFGLLGSFFGPFPDAHSSLTTGSGGIKYPTPSYRQDRGFGITWDTKIPLSKKILFTGSYGNFARTIPAYSFHVASTFVKDKGAVWAVPPRSDLGDRFDVSYFQNVTVSDPGNDYKFYSSTRKTLSLSTVSNQNATGRDDFGRYTKPIDLAYEQSQGIGGVGLYGQVRAQEIREEGIPLKKRVVGWVAGSPRPLNISPDLQAFATAESMVFGDTGFHWARFQTGLAYRPVTFLRFSGGGFVGQEWGNPTFLADRLDRKYGFVARGDLISGPTQFSYMLKFDPRAGGKFGQYDREYSVTQAIGILQAFINYREYPSQFRYGVVLRLDSILNAITQRAAQAQTGGSH